MSETILYDAEGMTAAAEQALKLKNAVDASHEDLLSLRSELKWAISCIAELDVASATSVIISKSKLEAQSEKLDSLADTLDMAADMANSTSSTIQDNLDFFLAILAMASSGSDLTARIAAGLLGTYLTISEIIGKISTGIQATLEPTPEELLEQLIAENPAYASNFATLREFGYTDEQIYSIAQNGGLDAVKAAVHESILKDASERTANILNSKDKDLPKVSANRYQNITGKQINCMWFSRQRASAIFGLKAGESYDSFRGGTGFSAWKKLDGKEVNGYTVDYNTVSASKGKTTAEALVEGLQAAKQPCSAMVSFGSSHCMTIDRIENGMVYFTDNLTEGGVTPYYKTGIKSDEYDGTWGDRPYTGQIAYMSLEKFDDYINNCCNGTVTAYATFTKTRQGG